MINRIRVLVMASVVWVSLSACSGSDASQIASDGPGPWPPETGLDLPSPDRTPIILDLDTPPADGGEDVSIDFSPGFDFGPGPCLEMPTIVLRQLDGCIQEGQSGQISVDAKDPCGRPHRLLWRLAGSVGRLRAEGQQAELQTLVGAEHPCPYRVTATLEAGSRKTERTFEIWVRRSGDANRDGRVDARDLQTWHREVLRINCCERGESCTADVDHNCKVDQNDYGIIVDQLASVGCRCP